MVKLIKRCIKNCTPFDWAYVCSKNNGNCKNCSAYNNECSFLSYRTKKENGDIDIETRLFFTDYQEEMLLNYFCKIIEEKEKQK